jgi:hypothetical protein
MRSIAAYWVGSVMAACARGPVALGIVSVGVIVAALSVPQPASGVGGPALALFVNEEVTDAVRSQFLQRCASEAIIINQGHFDPDNNGRFEHRRAFRQAMTDLVPQNYSGPVCLDWEGAGFAGLRARAGSVMHTQTLQAYLDVIALARELRPKSQLGYYNIPMKEYWNRDEAWRQRNLALQPIVDASDCLFPSVYDFYKSNESVYHDPLEDLRYVRECVHMALEMSEGRPVYPYVWPRYHNSNPTNGLRLIDGAEFKSHVAAVFETEFRGDRADGVVWWGADRYFRWLSLQSFPPHHPDYFLNLQCRNVFNAEIPPNTSDDAHFTTIHRRTLRQLSEVIRSVQ